MPHGHRDHGRQDRRAHRKKRRKWGRQFRVHYDARGYRCRQGRRYHRGDIVYCADLEDVLLGAVAYGIVREALD